MDFNEVKLCDFSNGFFDARIPSCVCIDVFPNLSSVLNEYIESIKGDQTNDRNVSDILNNGHFPKGFSFRTSFKICLILEKISNFKTSKSIKSFYI